MKFATTMCCLMLWVGWGVQCRCWAGDEPPVAQFTTEQLIEAFITYAHKTEKPAEDMTEQMRGTLQKAKGDPLLKPYLFGGETFNRQMVRGQIGLAKAKWEVTSGLHFGVIDVASDPAMLDTLTDTELVIVLRLMQQIVGELQ